MFVLRGVDCNPSVGYAEGMDSIEVRVKIGYDENQTPYMEFYDELSDEQREFLRNWFEWRSRTTTVTRKLIFREDSDGETGQAS